MFGQHFFGDAAPFEDLQHVLMAVVQQPGTDARLPIRADEVNRPIARGYVDQNSVHGSIVLRGCSTIQERSFETCAMLQSLGLSAPLRDRRGRSTKQAQRWQT